MGLIILIVIGAVLGWLASILLRYESRGSILSTFGAGIGGAVLGAIISDGVPLLSGIGAGQLFWAIAGAAFAIGVVVLVQRKSFQ